MDEDYDDFAQEAEIQIPPEKFIAKTYSASEFKLLSGKRHIISGLLFPGDIACIHGQPNTGKSVIAPYLAHCVAQGRQFFERNTTSGNVLYVAAEDSERLNWRILAIENDYGKSDGLKITNQIQNLYNHVDGDFYSDLKLLANTVKENDISLVIIDTLSAAFPGLDENNGLSMGRVISHAKTISAYNDAAVVLVHHDTKADGGTPRGHGSLNASFDMVLHLQKRRGGLVDCTVTKNRTGPSGANFQFTIDTVEVGFNGGLETETAPLLREVNGGKQVGSGAATKAELAAMAILDDLSSSGPVREKDWVAACAAGQLVSGALEPSSRQRVVRRIIQGLVGRGVMSIAGGQVAQTS